MPARPLASGAARDAARAQTRRWAWATSSATARSWRTRRLAIPTWPASTTTSTAPSARESSGSWSRCPLPPVRAACALWSSLMPCVSARQQPGPVNWATNNPSPAPGMVRLWTWEAAAHGADVRRRALRRSVCMHAHSHTPRAQVVSYFRWREAPFAQEQMHAGLNLRDGTADVASAEVQQVRAQPPHRAALSGLDRAGTHRCCRSCSTCGTRAAPPSTRRFAPRSSSTLKHFGSSRSSRRYGCPLRRPARSRDHVAPGCRLVHNGRGVPLLLGAARARLRGGHPARRHRCQPASSGRLRRGRCAEPCE
jgi:hypothetical protein